MLLPSDWSLTSPYRLSPRYYPVFGRSTNKNIAFPFCKTVSEYKAAPLYEHNVNDQCTE